MPNQLLDVRLHTIAISGLSRVRTELLQLLVIPPLAPKEPVRSGVRTGFEKSIFMDECADVLPSLSWTKRTALEQF
jgi:hypothetical protein